MRMPRRHVKRENSSEDRSRSILSLSLRRCSCLGIEAKERKSGNITEREEQNDGKRAKEGENLSHDPSRVFLSIKTVSNHVVIRTNCKRQSRSISVLFPRTREKTTTTTTASAAIRDSPRLNALCQTMTNTRQDRSDLFRAGDPRHSSLLVFNISPKITLIAPGHSTEIIGLTLCRETFCPY